MQLQNISLDDLPLYERTRCDPIMMAELGGPLPREGLEEKLRRDVASVENDESWIFKIMVDEDPTRAAGSVTVWQNSWRGETINEIGWMVLPEFQGRGLATKAVLATFEKARAEGRWDVIHAFPPTTNAPSNAICRKTGFTLIEQCDLEWAGRMLRCNHWRIDLR